MPKIGIGNILPDITNLPGQGGGGGGGAAFSTKSLLFDGTTDNINCGNVTTLNGLSHGSWSFWLNSSETSTQGIFNQWGSVNSDRMIYSFINQSLGRMDIYLNVNAAYRVSGNSVISALNTGEWFNLVIVFDGTLGVSTDRLKVYINDELLTGNIFGGPTTMPSPTSDLILGTYPSGTYWDGYMDEVGIWNSSLTQAAVTEIYNAGTPNDLNDLTNATNPSVWYRMGENATFKEPQILMLEQNNKDKVSNFSMDFDGVDDYVDCGNDSSLHNSNFTISLWVYQPSISGSDEIISNGLGAFGAKDHGFNINRYYGNYRFYIGDGTTSFSSSWAGAVVDTWQHLVMSYDGTDMKAYLNGVLKDTVAVPSISYSASAQNLFRIGKSANSGLEFTGNIDEVSLFSSAKAIGDLWDGSGKPTDLTGQSGLVSWWRMGEEAIFDSAATEWAIPDQAGSNDGVSANMDIYTRVGDAPNSPNNALSYNMDAAAIVEDTPPNP